jgi:hypothetical protein
MIRGMSDHICITHKNRLPSGKLTVRPWHFSGLEDSFPLNMDDFQVLPEGMSWLLGIQ